MSIERQNMRRKYKRVRNERKIQQQISSAASQQKPKNKKVIQTSSAIVNNNKNSPPIDQSLVVPNSTIVCIASGPSLDQDQIDIIGQVKRSQSLFIISVNDNWRWKYNDQFISDHLYAADPEWWQKYIDEINREGFSGHKWVPIKKDFAEKHGLIKVDCAAAPGLGTENKLHCNHNSGAQAINLAYFLGAKKIILVGYDMKVSNEGKNHWFGNHPKGLRNTPGKYKNWIGAHQKLNKDLITQGVECVNCTPDSAIPYYRMGILHNEL
jgi:hypothetical protein